MVKIPKFLQKSYNKLVEKAKKIRLPGFQQQALYDVGVFFVSSMQNGAISTRAAAVAFNFFMAIFPALIFIFTLIPYVPIGNFQNELLDVLKSVMPGNAFLAIEGTITDIVTNPRFDLLSFGFLATLYFSTNGINAIMRAFNVSSRSKETRSALKRRISSLWLFLIFTFLITVGVGIIVFSNHAFAYFFEMGLIKGGLLYYAILFFEWFVIICLFFLAISFMYYFAPVKRSNWRFISAGGSLATGLCILTSVVFSFYVNNFGNYNELYGSIGTIIVLMLLLQLNSQILLIGYELNQSISASKSSHK